MAKTVRLKDIADRIGVSTVTVSKALSGQKGMSEELREKIHALADEMGYVPSVSRKQDFTSKSYTIGVLISENFMSEYSSFYTGMHQQVSQIAMDKGCFTMLEVISVENEKAKATPRLVEDNKVDGIVVVGRLDHDYLKSIKDDSGVPMVYLDFCNHSGDEDAVVSDSYNGDELTIFASHLFENKQVVDMAYSKEPYRILWCVMSDGTLNALTYNKKQEVAGWHRHTTDGEFESVAVIREGFEDVAYFVVKRTINGQTKRFIERMHSRLIDNAEDGFFVDCGLKGEFQSEVTTISGLSHLEGKEVSILADGGAYKATVKNGSVTLQDPAKKIVVGLPYTFELETLNIEGENTHGLKKIITAANIKVEKSREDFFVVGDDGTEIQNARSVNNSVNDAGWLFSGDITVYPTANYKEDASIKIKQPYPLPLTITSISAVVTIEDEDTDVQSE